MSPTSFHLVPVGLGQPVTYWQLGRLAEERFDTPDQPMKGEMDPFFFLTRHKNFIPHEYPCRTIFTERHRGKRPELKGDFRAERWWLPFGSPRVDLSGFWFRPTRLACWARTYLDAAEAGAARLALATCGGAILSVNGRETDWMAVYNRNLETKHELAVSLDKGLNEVRIFFDDLAERDARYYFQLDYLGGPEVKVALPSPAADGVLGALEKILDGMRFDRTAYFSGDVTILLPQGMPVAASAEVGIEGDFMSTEHFDRRMDLPAGARSIALGPCEALPADFRHFRVTLEVEGLRLSRSLGVEICHAERQGKAPAGLAARVKETLDEVAENSEPDTVCAFARLATGRGGPATDAMIEAMLPSIADCHDCADFVLVPLIWARTAHGGAIGAATRDRIDRAILGYRYWMDEPGNDVQWYFSENHALLFHTAAYLAGHLLPDARFVRSGRSGAEQSKVGEERVNAWLDHFEHWEMAEFNSAPYFPIDLKGLTALAALAPDVSVQERARKGILRLLEVVARSSHHGMLTAAQGRSYEHTLRAGRSLELSGIQRLVWGAGFHGRRFHALPQLAVLIRDHGLEIPENLAAIASMRGDAHQEWRFAQGEKKFAALYHYKGAAFAMGTTAAYRWHEWGYQETVLHLRLGDRPEAQVWINHPGETIQSGYGRPSYWGGCGTIPRVHQYRGLALVEFRGHEGQPDFTHAWFPVDTFDEAKVDGNVATARCGHGAVLIKGSRRFAMVDEGPTAGAEIRMAGLDGLWIVRVSETGARNLSDFSNLDARKDEAGNYLLDDPEYGTVRFLADGTVEAEGRVLKPREWSVAGEVTEFNRAGPGTGKAAASQAAG